MSGTVTEEATRATAVATEAEIREEAEALRGEDFTGLDRAMFLKLWPLLRKPIPQGFIQTLGVVKGKPYNSTGIKSVQVQIDRMDNVLTPLGWKALTDYEEAGKVCHVTVQILDAEGEVLFERDSYGGVNQASTSGNLFKGSFTNAAKVAFARVGPGHEVYVGTTDLDPDVHEVAANAQDPGNRATQGGEPPLNAEQHQKILDAFTEAGITDDLGLYLTAVGVKNIEDVAASHAYRLRELLDAHKAKEQAK